MCELCFTPIEDMNGGTCRGGCWWTWLVWESSERYCSDCHSPQPRVTKKGKKSHLTAAISAPTQLLHWQQTHTRKCQQHKERGSDPVWSSDKGLTLQRELPNIHCTLYYFIKQQTLYDAHYVTYLPPSYRKPGRKLQSSKRFAFADVVSEPRTFVFAFTEVLTLTLQYLKCYVFCAVRQAGV